MIPDSWTSSSAYFTPLTWAVILSVPLVWPLVLGIATAVLTKKKEK